MRPLQLYYTRSHLLFLFSSLIIATFGLSIRGMSSLQGMNSPSLKSGDPLPPLIPSVLRLYQMRFCPFSQRVTIYLAKKGIRTDIVNINLKSKPEWYSTKNPKGSVPTIELDDKIVFDSLIIPEFLDDIYPVTAVLPTDPYTRARQRMMVERLSGVNSAYSNTFKAMQGKNETEIREAVEKLRSALDDAEKLAASNNPFFAGSSAGFPDYMVFPFFDRMQALLAGVLPGNHPDLADDVKQFSDTDFPGSGKWPKLSAWYEAMQLLDEIKEARHPYDVLVAFLKTYVENKPDYDVQAPAKD